MASSNRGRLTQARILEAGNGDHADGHGLALRVRGNAASWIFRYTSPIHGPKRREIGLGAASRGDREQAESAARNARALALEFAAAIVKGIDPKDERDSERAGRQSQAAQQARQKARARRTLGRSIRDFNEREIEASTKFTEKHKSQWIARRSRTIFYRGAVAIRDVGTCELRIPRDKYNPWVVLEALQRTQSRRRGQRTFRESL